jgi:hypothetical protein
MNKMPLFALSAGLVLNACSPSSPIAEVGAQAREYMVALAEDIGPRVAGSPQETEASQTIASAFRSFGYEPELQSFTENIPDEGGEVTSANVIAVKEGETEQRIIVGAHYDSVEAGMGADDNASGVAVILEVAEMLADVATPYTIVFVAYGAEEVGFVGSHYYVDTMTEADRANTIVVLNLDSLIAGDYAYVYGGDGEGARIRDWLLDWAEEEGLPLQTQSGENPEFPAGTTGDWSDHVPFKEAGITYVYFESTNWLLGEMDGYTQVDPRYGIGGEIWHTPYDNIGYIEATFPGRAQERLALFTSALYVTCTEYEVPGGK